MLWALQHWQQPGPNLVLALDTTLLWNRFCVVALSLVVHGRAMPLLWCTLEHPSTSVSAAVSIALLEKADRLLAGDVMHLRANTWMHMVMQWVHENHPRNP